MSLYEHVVITRPDVSTAQVEEFTQNLATKIENMGRHCRRRRILGFAQSGLPDAEKPQGPLQPAESQFQF